MSNIEIKLFLGSGTGGSDEPERVKGDGDPTLFFALAVPAIIFLIAKAINKKK